MLMFIAIKQICIFPTSLIIVKYVMDQIVSYIQQIITLAI